MPTNTEVQNLGGKWIVEGEFVVANGGAVTANSDGSTTTDPAVTCTKTGTGTYRLDIVGNFYKVVSRDVRWHGAAASSQQAQITAISLGGGTATATGESVTTVTIITGNSNAVPAAADQATGGRVSFRIAFQKNKL